MRIIWLLCGLVLSVGCANQSLRKNCEEANWYQRGVNQAQKGKMTDGDFYVKRCEAVNGYANYAELDRGFKVAREEICSQERAYLEGKSGKPYHFPICASYNEGLLRAKYSQGLAGFCQPENGYAVGKKGQTYSKVCPAKTEAEFLKQYEKGRKVFHQQSLGAFQQRMQSIDGGVANHRKEIDRIQKQIAQLEQRRWSSPAEKQARKENLASEIQSLRWKIESLQSERLQIQGKIEEIISKN